MHMLRVSLAILAGGLYAQAQTAASIAVPAAEHQQAMIHDILQSGLAYAQSLSAFACVQTPSVGSPGELTHTLVVDLDRSPNAVPAMQAAGIQPKKLLSSLFSPGPELKMAWSHWATLRGKRTAAFLYTRQTDESDYRGLIYTDVNRGVISRITFSGLPVNSGSFNCRVEEQ